MGKFDELSDEKKSEQDYEEIYMSLSCAVCGERSSHARRAIPSGIIGWKCPNEHKNLMEGFTFV